MKINAFFANRLKAPLVNHLWSWGAYDANSNRVFLRVGNWAVDDYNDGKRWVIVYDPKFTQSAGHSERLRHLSAIADGAEGYIVLVEFSQKDKIISFNDETLLRIGNITEADGLTYAEVLGEYPVDDVISPGNSESRLVPEIRDLLMADLPETTRKAMIDARVGQGAFRANVLRLWGYKCAVSGVTASEILRASHIKPWRLCEPAERLDPFNGLLLVATLDALFDKGLVSFDENRSLQISPALSAGDQKKLSLARLQLRHHLPAATMNYLDFHWKHVFQR